MPSFFCNFDGPSSPLQHFWELAVGGGRASLALRADWQLQLERARRELGFEYVRVSGIFGDEMGIVALHGNELIYSFFNSDRVFDFLLSVGVRPFVVLNPAPRALAADAETGRATAAGPLKDFVEWRLLLDKQLRHWIDRYGQDEVRQWYFEIWDEPNVESSWGGTKEDYLTFFRVTAEAIKSIDEALRIGGPAAVGGEWIVEFREFCERNRVAHDFVSVHHFACDPAEEPVARNGWRLAAQRAREEAGDKPLFYTAWNPSSNPREPLHDDPYAAAFIVKSVLETRGLADCLIYWKLSDIDDEMYFPSIPFHGGQGLMTLYGIPKPAYHAFALLRRAGDQAVQVEGHHETVSVWATRRDRRLTLFVVNHAPAPLPVEAQSPGVLLRLPSPPTSATLTRIDAHHGNPRRLWHQMGRPEHLKAEDLEKLQQASVLEPQPIEWREESDLFAFDIEMPPHGVAALELQLG